MTTDRKPICLMLVERSNGPNPKPPERCGDERIPGSDLCARHLGQAANDFRIIAGEPDE